MAWFYLFVAGVFEVQWAVTMKYTEGFSRLWPTLFCIVGMVASVWLLALAQRTLPVGTSYAIWVGIGAIGTALTGMWLFGESKDLLKIISLLLIVAGIIGLKISAQEST